MLNEIAVTGTFSLAGCYQSGNSAPLVKAGEDKCSTSLLRKYKTVEDSQPRVELTDFLPEEVSGIRMLGSSQGIACMPIVSSIEGQKACLLAV